MQLFINKDNLKTQRESKKCVFRYVNVQIKYNLKLISKKWPTYRRQVVNPIFERSWLSHFWFGQFYSAKFVYKDVSIIFVQVDNMFKWPTSALL